MTATPPRVAIVYPDYLGAATAAGFDRTLTRALPGTELDPVVVIAAVNAPAEHDVPALDPGPGTAIVHSPVGFNAAVLAGLATALELGARYIIRIDTAEHDPEHLAMLVGALDAGNDVVVADLLFDDQTLVQDTADSYHNQSVMPLVLNYLTGGTLALSGAHGYMGLRHAALAAVLPPVTRAAHSTPTPVMWGADTLLVTCAARSGLRVHVQRVPAQGLRNRPEHKAASQLRDTLTLHAALDDQAAGHQ